MVQEEEEKAIDTTKRPVEPSILDKHIKATPGGPGDGEPEMRL